MGNVWVKRIREEEELKRHLRVALVVIDDIPYNPFDLYETYSTNTVPESYHYDIKNWSDSTLQFIVNDPVSVQGYCIYLEGKNPRIDVLKKVSHLGVRLKPGGHYDIDLSDIDVREFINQPTF